MEEYKRCTNWKWEKMVSENKFLKCKTEELERGLRTKEQVVNGLTEVGSTC